MSLNAPDTSCPLLNTQGKRAANAAQLASQWQVDGRCDTVSVTQSMTALLSA